MILGPYRVALLLLRTRPDQATFVGQAMREVMTPLLAVVLVVFADLDVGFGTEVMAAGHRALRRVVLADQRCAMAPWARA